MYCLFRFSPTWDGVPGDNLGTGVSGGGLVSGSFMEVGACLNRFSQADCWLVGD